MVGAGSNPLWEVSKEDNYGSLAAFVLFPVVCGSLIGVYSSKDVKKWFPTIKKPSWQPPNWLFGPVWTVLYAMMGLASWLVWTHGGWAKQRGPLTLYLIQLGLNFLWNPLFFSARAISFALIEIIWLWISIVLTIYSFNKVEPLAAALLLPYLAWVSFATLLNYTIVQLNPQGSKTGGQLEKER